MEDVLIIKNISHEGPGLLADILTENNLSSRVVDLDAGEAFPDPNGFKAVIVLGGPDSANDTTLKMQTELTHLSWHASSRESGGRRYRTFAGEGSWIFGRGGRAMFY
jgi:GMP synthase-like glutamine amidotransferase